MSKICCVCDSARLPLCGYCADDLFCPQCGERISSVWSPHQQPEGGPIWLYPNDDGEFVFPLILSSATETRERCQRAPQLDREASTIVTPISLFEPAPEIATPKAGEVREDQEQVLVRLKPLPEIVARFGPRWWDSQIPSDGLAGTLTVRGDFREAQFALRICRQPLFQVLLEGRGVLQGSSPDGQDWRVWREGEMAVKLVLKAETAPVCFREPLIIVPDGDWAKLEGEIAAGTVLTPASPLEVPLRIDSSSWQVNAARNLQMLVPCDPPGYHPLQLTLRKDLFGDLGDWQDSPEILGTLHYGEFVERAIRVTNVGKEMMFVSQPDLVVDGPVPGGAFSARWKESTDVQIELDVRQDLTLLLTVDLREVTEQELREGNPLAARIRVQDELQRAWERRVIVDRVTQPPTCPHHLAIDFGNTNTYAAVWNPGDLNIYDAEIVPLLGPNPEAYPSLLFFEDVSRPAEPQYVVGPEAAELALLYPNAVVAGLKRSVGELENGRLPLRHVRDRHGNEASYPTPALIGFFLEGIVQQCEKRLRRRFQKVALSFPSLFSSLRLEALRVIAEQLVRSRSSRPMPPQTSLQCDLQLDEATAVAFGFALDDLHGEDIRPILEKQHSVVIATFDFGGGSIDIALVKMSFEGSPEMSVEDLLDFGIARNEFLHFGGDPEFGGDNVTGAVLELLHARLERLLQQADQAIAGLKAVDPDSQAGQTATDAECRNFRRLWNIAEQVKIYLCTRATLEREIRDLEPCGQTAQQPSSAEGAPEPAGLSAAEPTPDAVEVDLARQRLQERLAAAKKDALEKTTAALNDLEVSGGSSSSSAKRPLREVLDADLSRAIEQTMFEVTLDEVYDHRIRRDLRGATGYTVRGVLRACIEELCRAAVDRRQQIDFVVLAGAGCHVPLVQELMTDIIEKQFPQVRRRYDPRLAKSKVAIGLVRAMDVLEVAHERFQLRPSSHYLRCSLGLVPAGTKQQFRRIIPACGLIQSGQWYEFPRGLRLNHVWSDRTTRIVRLYRGLSVRSKAGSGPQVIYPLHGTFDLSQHVCVPEDPTSRDEPGKPLIHDLPDDLPAEHTILIRMVDSEDNIELKIETAEACFGYWKMEPANRKELAVLRNTP